MIKEEFIKSFSSSNMINFNYNEVLVKDKHCNEPTPTPIPLPSFLLGCALVVIAIFKRFAE